MRPARIIGRGGRSFVLPTEPTATKGCAGCGCKLGDPRTVVSYGSDGRRYCRPMCADGAAPWPYVAEVRS